MDALTYFESECYAAPRLDTSDEDPAARPSPAEPGAPDDAKSLVGRVLSGRYRIDELVAKGGMGAVYRGEHVLMRKRVAIKVLLPESEAIPELVARFEREAVAGAHVRHPNVAGASDFGREEDGTYFLVLEYVRGVPLHELIARGPIELGRALALARDLASALEAVHDKAIVHRDVKPRNVMVSNEGAGPAKLLDFGFAKVSSERLSETAPNQTPPPSAPPLTAIGRALGTVAYMAPECALGMDAVDARGDLYALGVVLYEMLAGRHPFEGTEPATLFAEHRFTPPPPFAARAPEVSVPATVEALVMRLLEKRRDLRFQTATEVVLALGRVMEELSIPAPAAVSPTASERPPEGPESSPPAGAPIAPSADAEAVAKAEKPGAAPAPRPLPPPKAPPKKKGRFGTEIMPRAAGRAARPRGTSRGGGPARVMGELVRSLAPPLARARERFMPQLRRAGASARRAPAVPFGVAIIAITVGALCALLLRGGQEADAVPADADAGAAPVAASAPSVAAVHDVEIEVDGADAATWRARLKVAPESKDWRRGAAAVLALARLDRGAFHDYELRLATLASIAGIGFEGGEQADQVFEVLTNGLGDDGVELLYDVVRSRGATKAATRALSVLESPEMSARVPGGMKLALELRGKSCDDKRAMFGRAAEEGDARVLVELQVLRGAECARRRDPCCFHDDPALAEAIKALKTRLAN